MLKITGLRAGLRQCGIVRELVGDFLNHVNGVTAEVDSAESPGGTFPQTSNISQAVSLDELINNEKEA